MRTILLSALFALTSHAAPPVGGTQAAGMPAAQCPFKRLPPPAAVNEAKVAQLMRAHQYSRAEATTAAEILEGGNCSMATINKLYDKGHTMDEIAMFARARGDVRVLFARQAGYPGKPAGDSQSLSVERIARLNQVFELNSVNAISNAVDVIVQSAPFNVRDRAGHGRSGELIDYVNKFITYAEENLGDGELDVETVVEAFSRRRR